MVMSYFHALMTKGFLEVKEDTVVATNKLHASIRTDHLTLPYEISND
jgi:hypothetical protein